MIPDVLFSTRFQSIQMQMIIRDMIRNPDVMDKHLRSRIALINKKKGIPSPGNIRPIAIQNSAQKFLELSVLSEVAQVNNDNTHIKQYGFKRSSSAQHAVYAVYEFLKNLTKSRKPQGIVLIDFSKAYDRVNRDILYRKMIAIEVTDRIINFIRTIHNN